MVHSMIPILARQITRIAHQANPTRVGPGNAPQGNPGMAQIDGAIDAYSREKKLMRVKAYDEMKLPQLHLCTSTLRGEDSPGMKPKG